MKRPFRLTPSTIIGTLIALIVAGVCIRLGIWQLDRRVERSTRNAVISTRISDSPLTLSRLPSDTAGLTYRIVELEGELDPDHGIVLAGRSHQGVGGVHLLVPLRLVDGTAILVNRGWIPALDPRELDPADYTPSGEIRLSGLILPLPGGDHGDSSRALLASADEASVSTFRHLWYRLDGEGLRTQSPYPLSTFYIQELSEGAVSTPPLPLPLPELDDGPHLGYAIQWFIFATIAIIGWIVLLLRSAHQGDKR